jgi:hypothetical protein
MMQYHVALALGKTSALLDQSHVLSLHAEQQRLVRHVVVQVFLTNPENAKIHCVHEILEGRDPYALIVQIHPILSLQFAFYKAVSCDAVASQLHHALKPAF